MIKGMCFDYYIDLILLYRPDFVQEQRDFYQIHIINGDCHIIAVADIPSKSYMYNKFVTSNNFYYFIESI